MDITPTNSFQSLPRDCLAYTLRFSLSEKTTFLNSAFKNLSLVNKEWRAVSKNIIASLLSNRHSEITSRLFATISTEEAAITLYDAFKKEEKLSPSNSQRYISEFMAIGCKLANNKLQKFDSILDSSLEKLLYEIKNDALDFQMGAIADMVSSEQIEKAFALAEYFDTSIDFREHYIFLLDCLCEKFGYVQSMNIIFSFTDQKAKFHILPSLVFYWAERVIPNPGVELLSLENDPILNFISIDIPCDQSMTMSDSDRKSRGKLIDKAFKLLEKKLISPLKSLSFKDKDLKRRQRALLNKIESFAEKYRISKHKVCLIQ